MINKKEQSILEQSIKEQSIKEQNLILGETMEINMKPLIEKHLDCKLKFMRKFHIFDYISIDKKIFVELKSRNNTSYKYPSTMVGYNKIIRGKKYMKMGYDVYFYFKFTDGLFYYKMNNKTKKECEIKIGGRCDRGYDEYKKYCFIPMNKIKKIET